MYGKYNWIEQGYYIDTFLSSYNLTISRTSLYDYKYNGQSTSIIVQKKLCAGNKMECQQ